MTQQLQIHLAKSGIVMRVSIYMYTHTLTPKSPFLYKLLQLRITEPKVLYFSEEAY